jgi:hypothetical protein
LNLVQRIHDHRSHVIPSLLSSLAKQGWLIDNTSPRLSRLA